MKLNQALIPHYRSEMIPTHELKKLVALNEKYLREKPTWYMIDNKLQYFKIRDDFRLFTEQFFSMFGREIMELDTLDYKVAYVRTVSPYGRSNQEKTQCGLLSESFQSTDYNYYLVSELLNAEISHFISYGGYTLENLLAFFRDYLASEDYKKNELILIKLFISDAFVNQEDRNYHNICFKIPKISGISYTQRLHPSQVFKSPLGQEQITRENDRYKLRGLTLSKIYDNEKILGVEHRHQLRYQAGQIWCPLFPYNETTLYQDPDKARQDSITNYDGLDPNLLSLYIQYPRICKPIFERLAYDDEYRKILERFTGNTSQICLSKNSLDYFTKVLEDKRQVFTRILKY